MPDSPDNQRPAANNSLPLITLLVLVGLIAALLYVGYDSLSDDTGNASELTNVPLDTTEQTSAGLNDNPENLLPDTTKTPAPVDLSQAPAPPDETLAPEPEALAEKEAEAKPEPAAPTPVAKPEPTPTAQPVRGLTSTYTVGDGETFYGVANRLNMKVSTLKALNPGVDEGSVQSGVTKLRVRVTSVHTVGPGDLLRVVAQKYGVSKEALMKANHKTKDLAVRGEKLLIPIPEKE